jgi:hypothetical protein
MKILATIALFMSVLSAQVHGQEEVSLALGLESASSGNCHGTFYYPSCGFQAGRNLFTVGPLCHKRSSEFRGARFGYSRSLSNTVKDRDHASSITDLVQLNVFFYAQYTDNLPLSYYVVRELECVSPTADVDWNKVRLSTAEMGAGIDLRVNITEGVAWRNFVGVALHHHTSYYPGMSRGRTGNSLMLGTGLLIVLP